MSAAVRHLLLYGTLRRSEPAHATLGLDHALRFVGPRTIAGHLYDLGDHPGLVPGDGVVHAELYRIENAGVLAALDRYEGSEFRRARRRIPGEGAGAVESWIYEWAGPLAGAARIPSGRYPSRRVRCSSRVPTR